MKEALTVAKAAEKLNCHPNTVKRIEKRLKLPIKRDYRNYRVYTPEVLETIKSYLNSER